MDKIAYPKLFEAVYHATARRLKAGDGPRQLLMPGQTHLVRAFDARYVGGPGSGGKLLDPKKLAGGITYRGEASETNRFSGAPPRGNYPNAGAIYLSLGSSPMGNELLHYGQSGVKPNFSKFGSAFEQSIASKVVLALGLLKPLTVLDLSRYSPMTEKFFDALTHDAPVKMALDATRYKGKKLSEAVFDGGDHSAARGVGVAVAGEFKLSGLVVGTARSGDRPGETGDNLVLFGPNNSVATELTIERAYLFAAGPKGLEIEAYDAAGQRIN